MEKRFLTISQTPNPDGTYPIIYENIPINTLYVGEVSHKPYPHTDRIVDPEWIQIKGGNMPKYISLLEEQHISPCGYNPQNDLYSK